MCVDINLVKVALLMHFQVALGIFFPFYVAAEIPSNLMMKATRPSLWIPSIMMAWGLICVCMGLVSNYGGLLAARAALGIAEGGLFPGITYYVSAHFCGETHTSAENKTRLLCGTDVMNAA
jgi:MFS family permease